MVRTADTAIRTGAKNNKAIRASMANNNSTSSSSNKTADKVYSGYNTVCPRETPSWQKPITNFFVKLDVSSDENNHDGSIKNITMDTDKLELNVDSHEAMIHDIPNHENNEDKENDIPNMITRNSKNKTKNETIENDKPISNGIRTLKKKGKNNEICYDTENNDEFLKDKVVVNNKNVYTSNKAFCYDNGVPSIAGPSGIKFKNDDELDDTMECDDTTMWMIKNNDVSNEDFSEAVSQSNNTTTISNSKKGYKRSQDLEEDDILYPKKKFKLKPEDYKYLEYYEKGIFDVKL